MTPPPSVINITIRPGEESDVASTNSASIRLHRRLGFVIVGTIPSAGFKFGRWVDTVLIQRALGRGDSTPP
jgi:L-amino acid N-acyltransferase YncA